MLFANPFRLLSTIAETSSVNEDDTLKTKAVLKRLGYYEPPKSHGKSIGMTGIPDRNMFAGLRRFQKDQGLARDGIMKPDGPTAQRIGEALAAVKSVPPRRAPKKPDPIAGLKDAIRRIDNTSLLDGRLIRNLDSEVDPAPGSREPGTPPRKPEPPTRNPHPPVYESPTRNPHPPGQKDPNELEKPDEPDRDEEDDEPPECERLNAELVAAMNEEMNARDEVERLQQEYDTEFKIPEELGQKFDDAMLKLQQEFGLAALYKLLGAFIKRDAKSIAKQLSRKLGSGVHISIHGINAIYYGMKFDTEAKRVEQLRLRLVEARERHDETKKKVNAARAAFNSAGCRTTM